MVHQLKDVDAHAPGLCCIAQLLAELHDAPGRFLGLAGYRGDAGEEEAQPAAAAASLSWISLSSRKDRGSVWSR